MIAGKGLLVMRGYILARARRISDRQDYPPAASGMGSGGGSVVAASPSVSTTITTTTTVKVHSGLKVCHIGYLLLVLEYTAGKQSNVCRGVWISELHNQCNVIEVGPINAGFTLGTVSGPQSGKHWSCNHHGCCPTPK